VNQVEHPHGLTLARVRRRALAGGDPQLAYSEWSGDEDAYLADPKGYAQDRRAWAVSNPGLGIRIPEEFLESQLRRLGPVGFATEHMSIGNWPDEPDTDRAFVVDPGLWDELVDRLSEPVGSVAFAVHSSLDRKTAVVVAAGRRADGLFHVEIVRQDRGVAWVVDELTRLVERHDPLAVVVDPSGPMGSFIVPLEQAGVAVHKVTAREYGQACGTFIVAAVERTEDMAAGLVPVGGLRHMDDFRLTEALEHAKTRPLVNAWAWDEKKSERDISPLVAVTLALHGVSVYGDQDGTVNLW
jgi:hypothetical protein